MSEYWRTFLTTHGLSHAEAEQFELLGNILLMLPEAQEQWQAEYDRLAAKIKAYQAAHPEPKRSRRAATKPAPKPAKKQDAPTKTFEPRSDLFKRKQRPKDAR